MIMLNCKALKDLARELQPLVGQRVVFEEDQFEQLWMLLKDAAIRLEVMEREIIGYRNHFSMRHLNACGVSKVVELRPSTHIKPPDDAA